MANKYAHSHIGSLLTAMILISHSRELARQLTELNPQMGELNDIDIGFENQKQSPTEKK